MEKKSILITILAFAFGAYLYAVPASATVGGPIYIERLSYSSGENAIYYLRNDQGGRGCPPEIEKINLAAGERVKVLSCDKIEAMYYTVNGSFDSLRYEQFVEQIFKDLNALSLISLPKNHISIWVNYIGEDKLDEYNVSNLDFEAVIFQGGQEKGRVNFTGCYKDQPNVFKGYMIPDSNKLALVFSRIGNCFEGGYTEENLHIIDNVNFEDTTPLVRNISGPSVHQGDLVVSAQNLGGPVDEASKTDSAPYFKFIGAAGLLLISAGLILKNRKHQNILYIAGGICLEMYSIYLKDTIFIILQIVFILSAVFDFIKLNFRK